MKRSHAKRNLVWDRLEELAIWRESTRSVQQAARLVRRRELRNSDQVQPGLPHQVLFGADANGNINPANNRVAHLHADVAPALEEHTRLTYGGREQPRGEQCVAFGERDLRRLARNELRARSKGSSPPTTPTGVFNASARAFQKGSRTAINGSENSLLHAIKSATSTGSGGTTSGNTSAIQAIPQVLSAFQTFQSSDSSDVSHVLYEADSSGNINPANNRAAFDAQVATDLSTLQASLHSALASVQNDADLLTRIDSAVTGTGADSLQTQLKNLTTPSGAYTLSARVFRSESTAAIAATSASVVSDIARAAAAVTAGWVECFRDFTSAASTCVDSGGSSGLNGHTGGVIRRTGRPRAAQGPPTQLGPGVWRSASRPRGP